MNTYFLDIADKLDIAGPRNPQLLCGECTPQNEEAAKRLEECLLEVEGKASLRFLSDVEVGKSVEFQFSPYKNLLPFAGYEDFWNNYSLQEIHTEDELRESFFHQWAVSHQDTRRIGDNAIAAVFALLQALPGMGYQHENSLIFLGKNAIEVRCSFNGEDAAKMTEFMRKLDDSQAEDIRVFSLWFQEDEEKHLAEKRQIFSSVLGDFLHEERTWNIAHLLENLHLLVKEVRGQYDLYMENFSYGKFVKKLEESNEKFVVRINDTLNKILSQVLALPIAATALNLFAKEKTAIGYVALLFYCALCFVALINQTQVLQHLHDELEDYQTSGKIPQTLTEQWEKQTQKLKKLFKSQRILAILMAITMTACAGYAGYALYS